MKKFLILLLILVTSQYAVFAGDDLPSDDWSSIQKMQDAWDGQKIIKDADFDKIIQQRTKKTTNRQNKKKGAELATPPTINETDFMTNPDQICVTLLVPQTLYLDNTTIPMGYYRVAKGDDTDGKHFINFYEGANLVAKVYANETDNDYGQKSISYLKVIYYDKQGIAKIIYGCFDYNLEAEAQLKP